jgi:hypothetical protein
VRHHAASERKNPSVFGEVSSSIVGLPESVTGAYANDVEKVMATGNGLDAWTSARPIFPWLNWTVVNTDRSFPPPLSRRSRTSIGNRGSAPLEQDDPCVLPPGRRGHL